MTPKNLLFIMSDEHNASFMANAGHKRVQTPNLDRLAERGTAFDNAYCNCPICVPSRASFATGRYVHDCGYWDNADPYEGSVPGWGHRLMEQGHRVVSIGKLHYRDTDDPNGFDEEIAPLHVVGGIGDLLGLIREEMPVRKGTAKFANDAGRGESSYTEYDRTIAAEASRWLRDEARKYTDKPWVLFVSFVCPHFPLIAPGEFYDLYAGGEPPWPDLYDPVDRPAHPYYEAMRSCINYDDHFDRQKIHRAITAYLGLCSFLDANIGTVIDALDAAGLRASTRIIYTSDHGEAMGKRGFWGKSTMFEESVRVPLIMAGPEIEQGIRVKTPVSLVDCHPTIIEAVGGEPHRADDDLPGRSLFAIAAGAEADRAVFSEYHAVGAIAANYMVRMGRFKLVYFVGMPSELYDLETDPDETRNLAGDPRYASVLARLETELRKICDPEKTDATARRDQQKTIDRHGGREAILHRGDFGHSPAPGQKPEFAS